MNQLITSRGYDFYAVASALQKTIRRNNKKLAAYFAMELFESNYHNYLWKRLFTISAEDVKDYITSEVQALYNAFLLVNNNKLEAPENKKLKGRIFITKAVFLLCDAIKSRDTDHANILIYDYKVDISDLEIDNFLKICRNETQPLPEYTFDCHTMQGKRSGKTKADFLRDEFHALSPVPAQGNFFDDLFKQEITL